MSQTNQNTAIRLLVGALICLIIIGFLIFFKKWNFIFPTIAICVGATSLWDNLAYRKSVVIDRNKIEKDINQNWITRFHAVSSGMNEKFLSKFESRDSSACKLIMYHVCKISRECSECCGDENVKNEIKNYIANVTRYRVQIENEQFRLGAKEAMDELIEILRQQCNFSQTP